MYLVTSLDKFRQLGMAFVSFQENIETCSPLGKGMFTIISAIAKLDKT